MGSETAVSLMFFLTTSSPLCEWSSRSLTCAKPPHRLKESDSRKNTHMQIMLKRPARPKFVAMDAASIIQKLLLLRGIGLMEIVLKTITKIMNDRASMRTSSSTTASRMRPRTRYRHSVDRNEADNAASQNLSTLSIASDQRVLADQDHEHSIHSCDGQ
jgi:hypothetical protein